MGITTNRIRINTLKEVYNLTNHQAILAIKIENNLNTEVGYQAYYDLTKSIYDNNSDKSILYDMAANFDWDSKLDEAFTRIAIADGREDLIDKT